jgi:glycosyltransferase involved in cell wall biosynthesis
VNCCHIVPSLEARHGGPSKSVLGLARALAQIGNDVDLLTTDPDSEWDRKEGRLAVHAFRRDWPASVCASRQLWRYLQSVPADVIHHHSIWLRTLHYANRAAARKGVRLVVSPRGMTDPWAWRHHAKRKAFARRFIHPGAFEAVEGWHATSDSEAAGLRDLGFRQPICVAPNGVSIPPKEDIEASGQRWRELLRLPPDAPVALFYSRFHRKKRLIELIDSWSENARKDWLLVVAGIPEEYTPRMVEAYVLRSGQVGRVIVANGTGMPPPYGIASLFVLPSHGENFGLSIAEALASGVPALVTDSTPWKGLNANGAGWCVPWADFGAAIKAATGESQNALAERGAVGRSWMERDFSWSTSAQTLSAFYKSLTAGVAARSL